MTVTSSDSQNEFGPPAGQSPYIPVRGSAWRLAVGKSDDSAEPCLIYGTYGGAIRCLRLAGGDDVWEVETGAFPFALAAEDIDGDGRTETIAALASGELLALDGAGRTMWTFRSALPLYEVAVGRLSGAAAPCVICGGIDRHVYVLSPEGELVAEHAVDTLVHRLAAGDLDGDGSDEIFAVDGRVNAEVLKLEDGCLRRVWRKTMTVPDERRNWENPGGRFFAFSLATGDLDGDGRDELVMGDTYFNRQAVMALSGDGEPLWVTEGRPWRAQGQTYTEYYSTAFVAIAPRPGGGRPRIVVVRGGEVEVLDADGNSAGRTNGRVGFTDVVVHENTVYLGSSPNGDDNVYRLRLDGDWPETVRSLERRGVARRVGGNLAELSSQVRGWEGPDPAPDREHSVRTLRVRPTEAAYRRYLRKRDWLREQFPYEKLEFVASMKVIEPSPPLDENGEPWSERRWRTDSINGTMAVEEIVETARWIEEHEVPTNFLIGHSCMPFITLETAEKMLRAAPDYLRGFLSAEDEQLERIPRYAQQYLRPLADLCREYGGKQCITKNKNVWWLSAPSLEPVFDALFSGERRDVLVPEVEDSNSRTPEVNLLGRFGLWMAGLVDRFSVSVHMDLFSFCRFHQWEYPKHGHPFLRLLVAHTLLGGADYVLRIMDVAESNGSFDFTDIGRESVEIFLHMLGKGIVFPPEREQMVGVSPEGIAVHRPPDKWLRDGHNGHNPQNWEDDPELHAAVVPHNGCLWGMTPTPEHALQRVPLNKTRQFGYNVPPTPYGAFVIVPAHADLHAVPHVVRWWHTDGIHVWREDGPRLTGQPAARALRESFEKAAAALPFRASGNVFLQAVRLEDGRYRLYAIDPGWLDPNDRDVTISIQREGHFAVSDLLSGDRLPVREHEVTVRVPAGSLRILEAVAQ
jgi:hypothetical protein